MESLPAFCTVRTRMLLFHKSQPCPLNQSNKPQRHNATSSFREPEQSGMSEGNTAYATFRKQPLKAWLGAGQILSGDK